MCASHATGTAHTHPQPDHISRVLEPVCVNFRVYRGLYFRIYRGLYKWRGVGMVTTRSKAEA